MAAGRQARWGRSARTARPAPKRANTTRTLMLAVALLIGSAPAAISQRPEPTQSVRQVVLDIISFTRWPQLPTELHLCVVGPATYAAEFFASPLQVAQIPILPTRLDPADPRIPTACNIVYEGTLTLPQREAIVQSLAGHPILTVGEATPGCIELTMFCLNIRGPQVLFSSNIDAIARSGVRLNPQVLMLGRRGTLPP